MGRRKVSRRKFMRCISSASRLGVAIPEVKPQQSMRCRGVRDQHGQGLPQDLSQQVGGAPQEERIRSDQLWSASEPVPERDAGVARLDAGVAEHRKVAFRVLRPLARNTRARRRCTSCWCV